MKLKTRVYCTLQFEGFHRWESAPEQVAYLASRHRHIFHVKAEAEVTELNRQIEFITLRSELQQLITALQQDPRVETWSCEMWAFEILCAFPNLRRVTVSEDNENGASVEKVD